MPFICFIIFLTHQSPNLRIYHRKKSICLKFRIYPCHMNTIGFVKNRTVYFAATYYHHFFYIHFLHKKQSVLKLFNGYHTLCFPSLLFGQHNIFSTGQWFSQRLKCFSAHHHRHSPCHIFKILHIIG